MVGPMVRDTDADMLRWVADTDRPFATPGDVLEHASVSRVQVNKRLDRLVEQGYLKVKKVGSGKVYWLTDSGREQIPDADD